MQLLTGNQSMTGDAVLLCEQMLGVNLLLCAWSFVDSNSDRMLISPVPWCQCRRQIDSDSWATDMAAHKATWKELDAPMAIRSAYVRGCWGWAGAAAPPISGSSWPPMPSSCTPHQPALWSYHTWRFAGMRALPHKCLLRHVFAAGESNEV